jgi:hypothetical protein
MRNVPIVAATMALVAFAASFINHDKALRDTLKMAPEYYE